MKEFGLGNVTKLTRQEWNEVRSIMGKPRRFSNAFLNSERKILAEYREATRKYHTKQKLTDYEQSLLADAEIVQAVSKGDRILALDPESMYVHVGTVKLISRLHNQVLVHFDSSEMKDQKFSDIFVMVFKYYNSSH